MVYDRDDSDIEPSQSSEQCEVFVLPEGHEQPFRALVCASCGIEYGVHKRQPMAPVPPASEQGAPKRIWIHELIGQDFIEREWSREPSLAAWNRSIEYTRSDICAAARREAFDKAIAIAKDYYALSAAHWKEQYGDVEISGALEAARDAAPREKTAIEAAGWLPIESAPKDGTSVLVALIRDSRVWRVSDARFNRIGWYTVHGGQSCHWSTHWMPLPEPAQAQKEKINGHQK
jgi:hypothetical protein